MLKIFQSSIIISFLLVINPVNVFTQSQITESVWEKEFCGLNFPEGPSWDKNGTLYISNCHAGWITKYSHGITDTFVSKFSSSGLIQNTNGLQTGKDGYIYACDYGRGAILKISSFGKAEILFDGFEGKRFNRPNDLVIDGSGNIYFTDPKSYDSNTRDGRIFYIDLQKGEINLAADSLAFPNGIAISPLNNKLYVSESANNRVLVFSITENNLLADPEVFISLPGGDPDGLEFDSRGNLYVAHFGSGTVFFISSKGEIIEQIRTPGKKPSNIEFGGDNLDVLYLTEDETNCVYSLKRNISGISN
jgi:gluconolactonase